MNVRAGRPVCCAQPHAHQRGFFQERIGHTGFSSAAGGEKIGFARRHSGAEFDSAVGRLAVEDHELGGFRIPKGSLVLASQFVVHHDPRFWERPEDFIPERWETQSVKEAGPRFIYFPFGAGVRRCIGESFAWTEGILLLATLARRWKLRLEQGQKIGLNPMITLRPKFGMRMSVHAK